MTTPETKLRRDVSEIYSLIPKIMEKVGTVAKGHTNEAQMYKYRASDDVVAALQPIFAELGVFVVPEVLEQEFEQVRVGKGKTLMFHVTLKVKHTFFAPDGSSVCAVTTGEATDSGDKAANKAMTSAFKYVSSTLPWREIWTWTWLPATPRP